MFCLMEKIKKIEIIINCVISARTKVKLKNFNKPFNLRSLAEYKNNIKGTE